MVLLVVLTFDFTTVREEGEEAESESSHIELPARGDEPHGLGAMFARLPVRRSLRVPPYEGTVEPK